MLFELGMLAYAATVLAGLPATADPWLDADLSPGVVAKTVVSDEFRFFVLAGLEGSGHHYVMSAGDAVRRGDPDLPRVRQPLDTEPFYLPFSMSESPSHYVEADLRGKEAMRSLAEQAAGLPSPTVYFLEIAMSYPRNDGPQKATQYNDLKRIAEEAESAGLDMRVVYLRRSAQDVIIANTVHRHFQEVLGDSAEGGSAEEHFLEYVRIFFTDTAVLQSFLGELDPRFVVCYDWDRLGDENQAAEIARFVSPNDEVAGMVSAALVYRAAPALHQHVDEDVDIDGMTFDGAKELVARLQAKLDSFEARYCGAPKQAL